MGCFRTVFLQFRRNAHCILRCPFFHDVKTSGCAGKVTQYINYPSIANRGPWSSLIVWVGDVATPAVLSGSSSLAGGKQVDQETTEHSCADRHPCQEDDTAGAAPGSPGVREDAWWAQKPGAARLPAGWAEERRPSLQDRSTQFSFLGLAVTNVATGPRSAGLRHLKGVPLISTPRGGGKQWTSFIWWFFLSLKWAVSPASRK